MRATTDGRTLNTAVFEQIREEILTGKLLPGQRLKTSLLARAHNVSLNVVREALSRLTGELLVEIEPKHGFTVRALSEEDLIDLVRQRVIFEGIAIRQSIGRGDVEWQSLVVAAHHRLSRTPVTLPSEPGTLNPEWLARHDDFNFVCLQACGSPRLLQMVRQLADAAAIYHRALLPAVGQGGELESEHAALLNAILDGNADTAALILTAHLEQTRDMMLPFLRSPDDKKAKAPDARGVGRSRSTRAATGTKTSAVPTSTIDKPKRKVRKKTVTASG
ncbi:GntR family transcriptional regulator [Caballeronia sp. LjRoot34]|uniref:GntR family transcriptional regulator n=1 Tax=Caballeronia sp. LjRoot34 TaxID=3342325 RepID=UPI003ECCEE93